MRIIFLLPIFLVFITNGMEIELRQSRPNSIAQYLQILPKPIVGMIAYEMVKKPPYTNISQILPYCDKNTQDDICLYLSLIKNISISISDRSSYFTWIPDIKNQSIANHTHYDLGLNNNPFFVKTFTMPLENVLNNNNSSSEQFVHLGINKQINPQLYFKRDNQWQKIADLNNINNYSIRGICTNLSVPNEILLLSSPSQHEPNAIFLRKIHFNPIDDVYSIKESFNLSEHFTMCLPTGAIAWHPQNKNIVAIAANIKINDNDCEKNVLLLYDTNLKKSTIININHHKINAITFHYDTPNLIIAYANNRDILAINTENKAIRTIPTKLQLDSITSNPLCCSLFSNPFKQGEFSLILNILSKHVSEYIPTFYSEVTSGLDSAKQQIIINFSLESTTQELAEKIAFEEIIEEEIKIPSNQKKPSLFCGAKSWIRNKLPNFSSINPFKISSPKKLALVYTLGSVCLGYLAWKYFKN
ncbi:MAG: hypothetical protein WDZ41_05530 [Candidatus Babeliales bacterium]